MAGKNGNGVWKWAAGVLASIVLVGFFFVVGWAWNAGDVSRVDAVAADNRVAVDRLVEIIDDLKVICEGLADQQRTNTADLLELKTEVKSELRHISTSLKDIEETLKNP